MKTMSTMAAVLILGLPCFGSAQTAVTQVEEAAMASQAATNAPDLKTAHTLAGQAIDGLAPAPVPNAGRSLKPAAPIVKLAKAAPRKSAGASREPGKLSELWQDNGELIELGGFWAGIGAIGMFVPVVGQIFGAGLAAAALCGMLWSMEWDFFGGGHSTGEQLAMAGVAAIGIAAVVAPPIGIPAMMAAGAAVALYGLAKIGAALIKKDG